MLLSDVAISEWMLKWQNIHIRKKIVLLDLLLKVNVAHVDIRPSANPSLQKAPLYEGVNSILEIFKIYVCVSLN